MPEKDLLVTEEVQDSEAKKREIILKKLKQIPDKENIVAVFVDDFKEQFLKELQEDITESVKTLWFPSEDVRINLEKITSDFRDTDYWGSLLQKYKDGAVEEKDMVDYIIMSHISVDPSEVTPTQVLNREVENGLKSRVGVKYLKLLTDTTNRVLKRNLGAMGEYLGLPESTPMQLLSTGVGVEEAHNQLALIEPNAEVQKALQAVEDVFTPKDEEQLVREFFAGDMIYDKLIDITYEELVDKLADFDDYEFDSTRTLIVDAGMEQQGKAVKRQEYELNPDNLNFSLYIVWLSNIFDGFGGTHSDDRGMHKYRIPNEITEEQFFTLMQLVKNRYDKYIEGRIEFSQLRMLWKTHKEINAKITSPYSVLTPYDKDVLLNKVIQVFNQDEHHWADSMHELRKIFKEINLV